MLFCFFDFRVFLDIRVKVDLGVGFRGFCYFG